MPYKSARACVVSGCPHLVREQGVSRCPEHQQEYQREVDAKRRAEGKHTDYGPEWRKISQEFLRTNPTCVRCGGRSEISHHIIERERGGSDDWCNLLPLCRSCHSKIHKDELGGFEDKR
jgi:5-methylcytosine-specific restriction enzyme A